VSDSTKSVQYLVRFRDSRNQVVELGEADGLATTLEEVVDTANALCKQRDTVVVIVRNGSLLCVVRPDEKEAV
jgi:hypothetical protein